MDSNAIVKGIRENEYIPLLGYGIYKDTYFEDGAKVPSNKDELVLLINNNRPMSERLMIDYPRALMSIEQRKGREYIKEAMNFYFKKHFTPPKIQDIIYSLNPRLILDSCYDASLLERFIKDDREHILIKSEAKILDSDYRYRIFRYGNDHQYHSALEVDFDENIIFKTLGAPLPEPAFIASDADFVDWFTETMGGFGIPDSIKEYKAGKKYLILGYSLKTDTERMMVTELTQKHGGGLVVLEEEPSKKGRKFLEKSGFEYVCTGIDNFTQELQNSDGVL